MRLPALAWRIGRHSGPVEFTPAEAGWGGRFDDPAQEFRTLYCAEQRITAFRETLQDLRPDSATIADLLAIGGRAIGGILIAGEVSRRWREGRLLVSSGIETKEEIADLDDVALRRELTRELAPFLRAQAVDHLDTSELTAKNRRLTQQIARSLYSRGAAGLLYRSNLDSQPCVALFQGRAFLRWPPDSEESLTEPLPELLRTCDEFDLILRHPATG